VAFLCLVVGLPVVVVTSLAKEELYDGQARAADAEAATREDRQLRVLTWRNAGAPLTCGGKITSVFDGAEFGTLDLGFANGAKLRVETLPAESSRVTLSVFLTNRRRSS